MPHHYTAYGLHIVSAFPCPEMLTGGTGVPDVRIEFGAVPESLENPTAVGAAWQAAPGRFLMDVHGVARYYVSAGRDITIAPEDGTDEVEIRVFLLGSVIAALLMQRNILTLHASAVRTDRGAAAFMGKSGSGKSTLLAALIKRGFEMMADDVVGIELDGSDEPQVLPAFPYVRLWQDAAMTLQYPVARADRLRSDMNKYVLPIDRFKADPLPLRAVYALSLHNRPQIDFEPADAMTAFTLLQRCVYRKRFIRGLGLDQPHFERLTATAQAVKATGITRPVHPVMIDELADRIAEDLA